LKELKINFLESIEDFELYKIDIKSKEKEDEIELNKIYNILYKELFFENNNMNINNYGNNNNNNGNNNGNEKNLIKKNEEFFNIIKNNNEFKILINKILIMIIELFKIFEKKDLKSLDQVAGHSNGFKCILDKGDKIWKPLNKGFFLINIIIIIINNNNNNN
jgi:hypothetical protein